MILVHLIAINFIDIIIYGKQSLAFCNLIFIFLFIKKKYIMTQVYKEAFKARATSLRA
jgi:hypothetical protein